MGALADFASATALEDRGDGAYSAELDGRYAIAGTPNGGYLLALLATAGVRHAESGAHRGGLRCLAASAAYARAARVGPATIAVEVDRRGARVTQAHAELRQDDRVKVRALLSLGPIRDDPAPRFRGPVPPSIAPSSTIRRASTDHPSTERMTMLGQLELHVEPVAEGDAPEVRAWARLEEGERFDDRSLLFLVDALPPASVPLGSSGWVPTIQLAASIRALPRSEWVLAVQRARSVSDGLLEQTCEVYDDTGTLVAAASQLAMARFGR